MSSRWRAASQNRIAVSTRSKPRDLKVVESVERDHAALELMARIYAELGIDTDKQVEGIDSQDKYAMLACGDADLYLRLPREAKPKHRAWDHAAGAALVQAAGGVVTDIDGSLLDFTHRRDFDQQHGHGRQQRADSRPRAGSRAGGDAAGVKIH